MKSIVPITETEVFPLAILQATIVLSTIALPTSLHVAI